MRGIRIVLGFGPWMKQIRLSIVDVEAYQERGEHVAANWRQIHEPNGLRKIFLGRFCFTCSDNDDVPTHECEHCERGACPRRHFSQMLGGTAWSNCPYQIPRNVPKLPATTAAGSSPF